MADVYLEPIITDARDSIYLASHPETFFKAMDDLKPYILMGVSGNCLRIKLTSDAIDLKKLRANLERLNNLGYHTYTAIYTRTYMGTTFVGLDDVSISWSNNKENYV